ncbi:MAG: amidophosphoribosyltransferase, partial [Gammaproteobacteria bacterium]|nr:amidophosphoribosyltransferase [Gammaproteobacteria bacterium]
PNGIRPAIIGRRETEAGTEYMVASESIALDNLEFEVLRDIAPGEAIYVDFEGNFHTQQCAESVEYSPCIFEHVYFARPDSVIDQISVYKARLRMGEKLAERILKEWPDHDVDVIIPIPDSSLTSTVAMAYILNKKMRHGFVKNRYIGRTFIMPGQQLRRKSVKQKLNAISLEFSGKNVLLVDDSIVRGTTSEQIIQMARDAGAKKVYFASAAPPVRYPNVYGIDMPSATELIAHGRDVAEVEKKIGADWLIFQELDDLEEACREGNPDITKFDASVFNGHYVTGDIDQAYLDRLEKKRNDLAKHKQESVLSDNSSDGETIIDLHNTD